MKKTPLKKVSKKRAQQLREYHKLKRRFLEHVYCCEFPEPCGKQAVNVHHIKGRNGNRLLDVSNWTFLCREHHRYIHDNPRWAKENGLLK